MNSKAYYVGCADGTAICDIVLAADRDRAKATFARFWRVQPGGLRAGSIDGRIWLPGMDLLIDRGR